MNRRSEQTEWPSLLVEEAQEAFRLRKLAVQCELATSSSGVKQEAALVGPMPSDINSVLTADSAERNRLINLDVRSAQKLFGIYVGFRVSNCLVSLLKPQTKSQQCPWPRKNRNSSILQPDVTEVLPVAEDLHIQMAMTSDDSKNVVQPASGIVIKQKIHDSNLHREHVGSCGLLDNVHLQVCSI